MVGGGEPVPAGVRACADDSHERILCRWRLAPVVPYGRARRFGGKDASGCWGQSEPAAGASRECPDLTTAQQVPQQDLDQL